MLFSRMHYGQRPLAIALARVNNAVACLLFLLVKECAQRMAKQCGGVSDLARTKVCWNSPFSLASLCSYGLYPTLPMALFFFFRYLI